MGCISFNCNFIGVDIKGARIWKGVGIVLEEEFDNVVFFCIWIEQLYLFFEFGEISEIWIIFFDFFLQKSKVNCWLMVLRFLDIYKKLLCKDGFIYFKIDELNLYEFMLEILQEYEGVQVFYYSDDIYSFEEFFMLELEIKIYYEWMYLVVQKIIKYICFRLEQ